MYESRAHVQFCEGLAGQFRWSTLLVVLCRQGTEQPMAITKRVLDKLGLTLNEAKNRVVDTTKEGFPFLGFELQKRKNWRTGKSYPHVQPSKKSLKKIKDHITALTSRNMSPLPFEVIVKVVNTALIGWTGYFHYRDCSRVRKQVREHAQFRLRIHLYRRHKIRDRKAGLKRYTNSMLYERYGLYKVPTTAVWR